MVMDHEPVQLPTNKAQRSTCLLCTRSTSVHVRVLGSSESNDKVRK